MRSRNYLLTLPMPGTLLLLFLSLFSHMAHSADPLICIPSNGYVPAIHMTVNVTVAPTGSLLLPSYTSSIPVAQPGPITCPSYTPEVWSVIASNNGITGGTSTGGQVFVGRQGFALILGVGKTPGYVANGGGAAWGYEGNTPSIPYNIYPSINFSSPTTKLDNPEDIVLNEVFVGYVQVSGKSIDDSYVPSDTTGLTAVYVSGIIHVPPYCELTLNNGNTNVTMPDHFAADFAAVGPGEPVGDPVRVPGKGVCTGGANAGDGDLVHISFMPSFPVSTYIAGISPMLPDVGIVILDDSGNRLPVDGTEALSKTTRSTVIGEFRKGVFDLNFGVQLVSRTGKAPTMMGPYSAAMTVVMSMD